jgi:hypothetical protein
VKKLFRILAAALVVSGLVFWFAKGANHGWTHHRVEKRTVDEVTGIEGITYEERFVPGVDFLAGTLAGAGALALISFLVRKSTCNTELKS